LSEYKIPLDNFCNHNKSQEDQHLDVVFSVIADQCFYQVSYAACRQNKDDNEADDAKGDFGRGHGRKYTLKTKAFKAIAPR
jgi:hypothetical protein